MNPGNPAPTGSSEFLDLSGHFRSACDPNLGFATYDLRLNALCDALMLSCRTPASREDALLWAEGLSAADGGEPSHADFLKWLAIGVIRFCREDHREAAKAFSTALKQLQPESDDDRFLISKAVLHNWQASLCLTTENPEKASRERRAGEAANARLPAVSLYCRAWSRLVCGKIDFRNGDLESAERAWLDCESALRQLPGRESFLDAECLRWQARSLFQRGALDMALKRCQDSLRIRERIDDEAGTAESLLLTGLIFQVQGETARAREHIETALKKAASQGILSLQGACHHHLREFYLAEGKLATAKRHHGRAAALAKRTGSPKARHAAHHGFLRLQQIRARLFRDERRRLRSLHRILERTQDYLRKNSAKLTPRRRARLLHFAGTLREDTKANRSAIVDYETALKAFSKLQMGLERVETLLRIAPLCAAEGMAPEAAAFFVQALDQTAGSATLQARVETVVDHWLDSLPPADFCRRLAEMERELAEARQRIERERREWRARIDYLNRQKLAFWLAIGHLASSGRNRREEAPRLIEEIFALCFDRQAWASEAFERDTDGVSKRGPVPIREAAAFLAGLLKEQLQVEIAWSLADGALLTDREPLGEAALSCVRLLMRLAPAVREHEVAGTFSLRKRAHLGSQGEVRIVFESDGLPVDSEVFAALLSGRSASAKPRQVRLSEADWPDLGMIEPSIRLAGGSARFESTTRDGNGPDPARTVNRFELLFPAASSSLSEDDSATEDR